MFLTINGSYGMTTNNKSFIVIEKSDTQFNYLILVSKQMFD